MHNKGGGVLRKQMKVAVPGCRPLWISKVIMHVSHTHTSEFHPGRVDVCPMTESIASLSVLLRFFLDCGRFLQRRSKISGLSSFIARLVRMLGPSSTHTSCALHSSGFVT